MLPKTSGLKNEAEGWNICIYESEKESSHCDAPIFFHNTFSRGALQNLCGIFTAPPTRRQNATIPEGSRVWPPRPFPSRPPRRHGRVRRPRHCPRAFPAPPASWPRRCAPRWRRKPRLPLLLAVVRHDHHGRRRLRRHENDENSVLFAFQPPAAARTPPPRWFPGVREVSAA